MNVVEQSPVKAEAPTKKIAIFVATMSGFTGEAACYMMCPAFDGYTHVIVNSSGIVDETMVFPSNPQCEVDWLELVCFKPHKSHRSALYAMGYELVK